MKIDSEKWLSLVSGKRKGTLPTLQRTLLALASLPYCVFMQTRNRLYNAGFFKQHQASVPVIVVGNLTVGGTGKTPAVEYVARFFRTQDRQVALLSRGYGSAESRNDEALVLESNLDDVPHLQGADRVSLANTAIEELESDLLVLDDGFQHRRLKRDLDIVLVDATNPWGYGWCLPRGLLREPRSGLRRAGLILITRSDQVDHESLSRLLNEINRIAPNCIVAQCKHAPLSLQNTVDELPVTRLTGRRIAAFCGIGNAAGFWKTLQSLGCSIIDQKSFPDHHQYQREDVDMLQQWAAQLPADTWILTTQKDWVKLRIDQLGDKPLWSLRIALEITQGRSAFESALLNVIGGESRDRSSPKSDSSSLPFSSKDAYDYSTTCPV
ncbi:MAG TPA: tetraacyldisaccharide 4'-kinase [Gemmatales bacterium]|nr:tetraacyldisaccharide 4'-kinase [Gemmatales bacterium]